MNRSLIACFALLALLGTNALTAVCRNNPPSHLYEIDVKSCLHPRPCLLDVLKEKGVEVAINRILAANPVTILRAEVIREAKFDCHVVEIGQPCKRQWAEVQPDKVVKFFYVEPESPFLCDDVKLGRRLAYLSPSPTCDDTPGIRSTWFWFKATQLRDPPEGMSWDFEPRDTE